MSLTIQRLLIYPIKSLQPVEVDTVELTAAGLRFDRSFALIYTPEHQDTSAQGRLPLVRHLTIKKTFKLALFRPSIDESWTKLSITYVGVEPASKVTVPLIPSPLSVAGSKTFLLSVFGTTTVGTDLGEETASFFTEHLGTNVRLVFIGGRGYREIPGAKFAPNWFDQIASNLPGSQVSQQLLFADAAPLLVTSTASEQNASSRLLERDRDEDIILRFRPNIHIDVAKSLPPFDEDNWRLLKVHNNTEAQVETYIKCVYPCVRCLSINADLSSGNMTNRERQLYGLLARDRRVNEAFPGKPVFGQYAFASPVGAILRVGDKISIIERAES